MDQQNNRIEPQIHPSLRRPGFGMPLNPKQVILPEGSKDPTPDMLAADRQPEEIESWFRTNHGGGGPR